TRRARSLGTETLVTLLFIVLFQPGMGGAMTTEELMGALKKAGAGEVEVLKAFPLEMEEKRYDFLGEGTYVRVNVLDPHHPHVLHYGVGPGGKIYRMKLGKGELERMRTDLKVEIKSGEMALRYAQWVLEVMEGPALWLVSTVEDVPFQPVGEGE